MACRFLDGFDHYATAQLPMKYSSVPGTAWSVSQGSGRESGGGALFSTGAITASPGKILTSEDTWYIGFALSPSSLSNSPLRIFDSATSHSQALLTVLSTGAIEVTVAAGTYSSATGLLAVGAWAYIEVGLVINATTGSVTVRINGASVIAETGINTATSGTLTADTFILSSGNSVTGANSSTSGYYDDLYAFDGTGSANNTFPASIPSVQALYPTGDGALAQWTPSPYASNFANVDDDTPDGDATSNQTGTVGNVDAFTHEPLRPSTGTVFAVQHVLTARTAVSTAHSVAAAEVSGGTTYPDTGQVLQTAYSMLTFPHDTDPATSAAFTIAGVNALEFGYDLTA